MPAGKKDSAGRGQNGLSPVSSRSQKLCIDFALLGNRPGFRTDTAISNNRPGNERVLQPWVPDADDLADGSLEKSTNNSNNNKPWDQFAANEKLFGVQSDYDENMYTTSINRNHPQYRERIAQAERKAREIERSTATTAHVAEERVMDYVSSGKDNGDDNEEDKYAAATPLAGECANIPCRYSGVRRQDLPPTDGAGGNKYTPPAKRAPSANSTVKGAPIDPAIISSQIKAPNKSQSPSLEESKKQNSTEATKNGVSPNSEAAKQVQANDADASDKNASATDKTDTPGGTPASGSRTMSPQVKENTPSATETVERDVLQSFKSFASHQREVAQKARSNKAKADKEVKLTELKKFADGFKLSTPVPGDLVSIIAKDPSKQKEIQAKAIKNAEEVAKEKAEDALKKTPSGKDASVKAGDQSQTKAATDNRAPRAPNAPTMGPQAANRQPRQSFPNQPYPFRNNRGGPQQMHPQQQTGNFSQRQQKYGQPPAAYQHMPGQDGRAPPTGPANNADPNANRRLSGVPSMGAKLNPNSHEFRPNAFATPFNPAGPSASSSPRSSANNAGTPAPGSAGGSLTRRKGGKNIDLKQCAVLSQVQTLAPPEGRHWNDNAGLRPSYDTLPTWRQLRDEEKQESTMHLTYKEFLDRRPFTSTMATPNTGHVLPHVAHQHQLPLHLQQGGPNMGPRQSPHMSHMQMHTPQHGPGPHPPYGQDDHRMVHSNSAQSFASPRLGQASMAYPGMNSPAQMQYNQPMFMGPSGPQMGQFRSFSNNPQYMPPQHGQMGGPMMMQPHFMPGPQGMGGPHMMYPGGGSPHFMPPGGPPQQGPGANGYPSPGRPSAPMMAHQGSQQGQPMYGMSPNVQYSQPTYGPGQQPGGPSQ